MLRVYYSRWTVLWDESSHPAVFGVLQLQYSDLMRTREGRRGNTELGQGPAPLLSPSLPRTRSTAKNFNAHTNENQRKDTMIGRQIIVWFVQTCTVSKVSSYTQLYFIQRQRVFRFLKTSFVSIWLFTPLHFVIKLCIYQL